jgi:hypothetical protein
MIASATPGAAIYYTLDGSEPTKTNGTLYNKPIEVAGSSSRAVVTVRATAFHVGMLPSLSITHSYVFPASVLNQPDNPGGFPSNWNGFPTDYEMDPQILSTTSARELAIEGLGSLPVVSIVTDTDNLFSASSGIYANSNNSGPAWERPVSAELFFPDGSQEGFQLDCGLRIQGGSSVVNFKSIKLSMRMLFKDDYGYSKLEYKLYPDSPVEQFDTLILDAGLNLTWTHPDHGQRVRAQYVRDQYVSDIENAMGQPAPHGRFVHVFLNGLYWGMYDLHEKPDHSFSAEYFGGEKEDYDAFKHRNRRSVGLQPLSRPGGICRPRQPGRLHDRQPVGWKHGLGAPELVCIQASLAGGPVPVLQLGCRAYPEIRLGKPYRREQHLEPRGILRPLAE